MSNSPVCLRDTSRHHRTLHRDLSRDCRRRTPADRSSCIRRPSSACTSLPVPCRALLIVPCRRMPSRAWLSYRRRRMHPPHTRDCCLLHRASLLLSSDSQIPLHASHERTCRRHRIAPDPCSPRRRADPVGHFRILRVRRASSSRHSVALCRRHGPCNPHLTGRHGVGRRGTAARRRHHPMHTVRYPPRIQDRAGRDRRYCRTAVRHHIPHYRSGYRRHYLYR